MRRTLESSTSLSHVDSTDLAGPRREPWGERERLSRFCARLAGDTDRGEDLAQETLLRAWRHAGQLRDPGRRDAWLKAIARNLYRRGARDRPSVEEPLTVGGVDAFDRPGALEPADPFDVEAELDRRELADLLDRAMALLPADTRDALVERFVRETPLAEVAERFGQSPGAVAMRVQRGKLALRRILVTAFPQELESRGVNFAESGPVWKPTAIWCPWCGARRLEGILARDLGTFRLRCPTCGRLNDSQWRGLFAGTTGPRDALERLLAWIDRLYQHSFDHSAIPCRGCGTSVALRKDTSGPEPRLSYSCARCHCGTWNGQLMNLLAHPAVRQLWRDHPRVRRLPEREVEAQGRAAIVAGFESVTDADRVELVYARDSLVLLQTRRIGRRG